MSFCSIPFQCRDNRITFVVVTSCPTVDSFLIPTTPGIETLGFSADKTVSVVLEDDGTIVEDDAYFLCLPVNTKFMLLHEKETWAPINRSKQLNSILECFAA